MTAHDAARGDRIVEAIAAHEVKYGHPPTVRQLMSVVGLASTSAVHHHLRRLVKEGRLFACGCGCRRASAYQPGILAEAAGTDLTATVSAVLHRWKHPTLRLGAGRCRCVIDAEQAVSIAEADGLVTAA